MNDAGLPKLVESQKWKFWLCGILIVVAGIMFVFTRQLASIFNANYFLIDIAGVVIGGLALGFAWLYIRCPFCGFRLVKHALLHKNAGEWLDWVLTAQQCPHCGATDLDKK